MNLYENIDRLNNVNISINGNKTAWNLNFTPVYCKSCYSKTVHRVNWVDGDINGDIMMVCPVCGGMWEFNSGELLVDEMKEEGEVYPIELKPEKEDKNIY